MISDSSKVLNDISAYRAAIFKELAKRAKGLRGDQVVEALNEASKDIYEAGLDRILRDTKISDLDSLADAFDLTWLSAWAIRLDRLRGL